MNTKSKLLATSAMSLAGVLLLSGFAVADPGSASTTPAGKIVIAHMAQGGHSGGGSGGMHSGGMMGKQMMHGRKMDKSMMGGHGMDRSMMQGHMMQGQKMHGGRGGHGMRVVPARHLTVDDTKHYFEHHLKNMGHKRLKVGEVKQLDEDSIVAEIVTLDGSLVQRFKVDRHTGAVSMTD